MIHTEQDAEKAFNIHKEIEKNELERRNLLAKNVELISQMKNEELYKIILGDDKSQWAGYLGQIEVMYSRNDVYNMIRIQQKYCNELGITFIEIADIPKSRLLSLIPIVTKENLQDWLSKARVLTNADFNIELRQTKGLPTSETCEHKMEDYEICSECGLKHRKDEHKE
jgi:hypothetical protein